MFIIKMFRDSFKFKTLLKNVNYTVIQTILYFILLILIANFPQTLDAVRNYGTRLDFIIEDFNRSVPINWDIPQDIQIKGGRLINNGNTNVYINEHEGITYIINNQTKVEDPKDLTNHIIMSESSLIYIDHDGNILEALNYIGFENDVFDFYELSLATGEDKTLLYKEFAQSIERTFQSEIIAFTIIRNIAIQLFINLIYVLLLALFIQLFRFGLENFLTYLQGVKFIVLSLGLASILTFIVGIFEPAFAPVIFQLASGMTVMLVTLIFARRLYS